MRDAYEPMNHTAAAARQRLAGLLDRYKAGGPITAADAAADRKTVDAAMEDLDHVATSCLNFVSSRQQTASSHLASNVILIAGLSLAAVLAAIGLSVYHDRLVMAPLQRLRQGVRRVAERSSPRSSTRSR